MGQQQLIGNTQEYKTMKMQIMKLIFVIVTQTPSRLELLGVDKELLETLELGRMLKSQSKEETELATNFSIFLLHHE